MGYLTDKLKDYLHGNAMRNNPQYRQQYESDRIADVIGELYGNPSSTYELSGPPLIPGETATQEIPGTGLFDTSVSPQERFMKFSRGLLESGVPSLQKMGQSSISNLQGQMMSQAGVGDSIPWEEWEKMTPAQQSSLLMWRGDMPSADIQEASFAARDPNFASALHEAKSVGQKYIKLGDKYYDPKTEKEVDARVAEGVMEKESAEYVSERMTNFGNHWNRADSLITDIDRTKNALDNLKDLTGKSTTSFATILRFVPGTNASYWKSVRDMIVSNISLQEMARLKAESPSGATGFGSLSEAELAVLTDRLGKLNQTDDPKHIKKIITDIYGSLDDLKFKSIRAQNEDLQWAKNINKHWGNRFDNIVYFDLYENKLNRRKDYIEKYKKLNPNSQFDFSEKITETNSGANDDAKDDFWD